MVAVAVEELAERLPELLERVAAGEHVSLQAGERQVARLMPPERDEDEFEPPPGFPMPEDLRGKLRFRRIQPLPLSERSLEKREEIGRVIDRMLALQAEVKPGPPSLREILAEAKCERDRYDR